MQESKLVLYGAGAAGRYALKHLRERGIEPLCFVDTDRVKFGTLIDGLMVTSAIQAHDGWPGAKWVACAISRPAATEIREAIRVLSVESVPLYACLPVCHGLPPKSVDALMPYLLGDEKSLEVWADQLDFRANPDYDRQIDPSPISELYFPPFIKHLDLEHYVDAGACAGETIKEFCEKWPSWKRITAFEPDRSNYAKLYLAYGGADNIVVRSLAVGDITGHVSFSSHGDYSSHIGGEETVLCIRLDDYFGDKVVPPTYIKMDIEGVELQALWGARRILKEHFPVLAICAYHTSDHLWEIPLLIHAIQPDYKLFFQRYGEGAFETVWYAVPPDRIVPNVPASHESYSDNHTG